MVSDSEQVFYKMSELSEMLGVETSVLRFWEKEFPQIKPMKVSQRKRLYRRKDLDAFKEIKRLLYEERFTIAGARKRLSQGDSGQGLLFDDKNLAGLQTGGDDSKAVAAELEAARQTIKTVRRDLAELRELISRNKPASRARRLVDAGPGTVEFDPGDDPAIAKAPADYSGGE